MLFCFRISTRPTHLPNKNIIITTPSRPAFIYISTIQLVPTPSNSSRHNLSFVASVKMALVESSEGVELKSKEENNVGKKGKGDRTGLIKD